MTMKRRIGYVEPFGLALTGCLLMASSFLPIHLVLLDAIMPSPAWVARAAVLHQITAVYGAVAIAAAAVSLCTIRRHNATLFGTAIRWAFLIGAELAASWIWMRKAVKIGDAAVWLTLMTALGAAVRCYYLAQPMRYDEAVTFVAFVNRGPLYLFYYPAPNNHVLHTLLVRLSVGVFGGHPAAIRLPAVLAGIATIPATFCLSRLLTRSSRSGFLGCTCVALFPYLVFFDTMARGYSLLVLLSLCLAGLSLRLVEHPSRRLCCLVSFVVAAALWDVPTFLFPAAGVFLWVLLNVLQRGRTVFWAAAHLFVPCGIMTAGLVGLMYTPTFIASNGAQAVLGNRFVKALSWPEFLNGLPAHVFETATDFTRDIPSLLVVAAVTFLAVGFCILARQKARGAVLLLPCLALAGGAILLAKHAIPFPRTWIYAIPFLLVVVDVGFAGVLNANSRMLRRALLGLAGCSAVLLVTHGQITSYPDTGYFPEAPVLVDVLSREMAAGDELAALCPANAPLRYYLWQQGVPRRLTEPEHGTRRRRFFVVKAGSYTLADLDGKDARKIFEIGDARLYAAELPEEVDGKREMTRSDRQESEWE